MNVFIREMQKRHRARQKETAEAKMTAFNAYLELCGYKNDLPQAERESTPDCMAGSQ